jgi:hypothetical protein
MPTPEQTKAAGYSDVSDWGEKDVEGAYPPGTKFDLGDGEAAGCDRRQGQVVGEALEVLTDFLPAG